MTTLYRKYRPSRFAEVEGQEHVVQTLHGALASGKIGHAYLFCGPRGTGKTTMARLLAKVLNCEKRSGTEPCNQCFSCSEINAGKSLDLIEIDAASNRGIDEIRSVKESAGVAASSSAYKIFIIDETHMLTKEAFNALLKTLEEPPSHVIFILATTEPHKMPATILSRVQRLDFKKLSTVQIIAKLKKVAKAEKLTIDTESLDAIATSAEGSLRDAESSMAKIIAFAGTSINVETTTAVLGIVPTAAHEKLLDLIREKKTVDAITHIDTLYVSGVNLENFTKQFIDYVRSELIKNIQASRDAKFFVKTIERFMQARTDLRHTPIPQLPLELAILDLTHVV